MTNDGVAMAFCFSVVSVPQLGEKKKRNDKKKKKKNNANVNVQSSLKHLVSDAEPSKAVHPRPVTQPIAAPHTHTLHICILI